MDQNLNKELIDYVVNHNIRNVHCYLSMGSEIDLRTFIDFCLESNRTIIAPQSLTGSKLIHKVMLSWDKLDPGPMNTYHPSGDKKYNGTYDLIIVPGLVFGLNGHRIGYGKGYYDRFLARHEKVSKIALCYNFQILEKIPNNSHDQKVNELLSVSITNNITWLNCK